MSLKFSLSCLFGSCLLLFAACKQQDQKLIAQVEADLQRWQTELGPYEAIAADLEKFRQELDTALPNQEGAPADSLKTQANAMVNREKAAIAAYKENLANLTEVLTGYQAGTFQKEDLELQHKGAQASLQNMGKTFTALAAEYKQRQAELSARQQPW